MWTAAWPSRMQLGLVQQAVLPELPLDQADGQGGGVHRDVELFQQVGNGSNVIPDAMAVAVFTPAGTVIQTGDFKIDYTPIEGGVTDLGRFAQLGEEGVLCLRPSGTGRTWALPGFRW